MSEVLKNARKQAFRGGISGSIAQAGNVCLLMWLRTTMTHQYRNGGSMAQSLATLYADGGIPRFYRGVIPALIQSPLSRFGDTAANHGTLAMLEEYSSTRRLPIPVKTGMASAAAAGFRALLMPMDTWKTAKQIHGSKAGEVVKKAIEAQGVAALFNGTVANMTATWVGHFPWFATYNFLRERLPESRMKAPLTGFGASCVSDVISNSLRIIKTTKQTSDVPLTYTECAQKVINEGGIQALLFRGLGTRMLCNGLQGMVFSVGIKKIMAKFEKRDVSDKKEAAKTKA